MSFGETDDQAAMMMVNRSAAWMRVVAGFLASSEPPGAARVAGAVEDSSYFDRGVRSYVSAQRRVRHEKADYVLNCIPMHLLAGIEHNFPEGICRRLHRDPRGKLFKIGLQMKERFWERKASTAAFPGRCRTSSSSGIRRTASIARRA
jgi:monoamine oxidase